MLSCEIKKKLKKRKFFLELLYFCKLDFTRGSPSRTLLKLILAFIYDIMAENTQET